VDHDRSPMGGRGLGVISGEPEPATGQPESATGQPDKQLSLGCHVTARGEVVLTLTGELDLASAERAFGYVRDAIDRHDVPVVVDLASLSFCDARGLGTLLRMSRYADQAGRALRLMSPQPQLQKIMRITGLDGDFLVGKRDPSCCGA
jgi:anti-sigma B factor antagonist